ncbi:MAG: hypothetical protein ACFFD1_12545, partial [Candidatus Thorarchaeota archaeon]
QTFKEDRLVVKEIKNSENGLIIYFCQSSISLGNPIILACFCSKECGKDFKIRLKHITALFRDKFSKQIIEFTGNTLPFDNEGIEFLENSFFLVLLRPFKLNIIEYNHFYSDLPEYRFLLNVVKEMNTSYLSDEGFYLKELVDVAIRKINLNYYEVIGQIIFLIGKKVLSPLDGDITFLIDHLSIIGENTSSSIENLEDIQNSSNESKELPKNLVSTLNEIKIDQNDDLKDTKNQLEIESRLDSYTDKESFLSSSEVNLVPSNIWIPKFLDDVENLSEVNLSNKNLIFSTLLRELDYNRKISHSETIIGKGNLIKRINLLQNHYSLAEELNNVFNSPKYVLQSNTGEILILSIAKHNNEIYTVFAE